MLIPQIENLHKQNFTSELVEFVWLFQEPKGIKQFVFGVKKDKTCYIEFGPVDVVGNYINEPHFYMENIEIDTLDSKFIWPNNKFPIEYNNFLNGRSLIPLAKQSIDEYLRFT